MKINTFFQLHIDGFKQQSNGLSLTNSKIYIGGQPYEIHFNPIVFFFLKKGYNLCACRDTLFDLFPLFYLNKY